MYPIDHVIKVIENYLAHTKGVQVKIRYPSPEEMPKFLEAANTALYWLENKTNNNAFNFTFTT